MQTGQDKFGMQTFNQSLYTLYSTKQISLETAMLRSSNQDELQDMINRGSPTGSAPKSQATTYVPAAKR